jgi:hypothetical protein
VHVDAVHLELLGAVQKLKLGLSRSQAPENKNECVVKQLDSVEATMKGIVRSNLFQ